MFSCLAIICMVILVCAGAYDACEDYHDHLTRKLIETVYEDAC